MLITPNLRICNKTEETFFPSIYFQASGFGIIYAYFLFSEDKTLFSIINEKNLNSGFKRVVFKDGEFPLKLL